MSDIITEEAAAAMDAEHAAQPQEREEAPPEPEYGDESGEGEEGGEPDEELEEVEHNGRKYAIPKALNAERLMQADYSRKTAELAEERKALATQRDSYVGASAAEIEAIADLRAIDKQLEPYTKLSSDDWQRLRSEDPDQFEAHWTNRTLLTERRNAAFVDAQTKAQARQSQASAESAKATDQANQVLARDIKGWGPEMVGKLEAFAISEGGFSREQLIALTRGEQAVPFVKLVHAAYEAANVRKSQRAAAAVERTETVRPPPKLNGGSSRSQDPSKMSTGDFMKWANAKGGPLATRT